MPKSKPKPEKTTNWDLIFKIVTAAVAIAGVVFGIYQYNQNRLQEQKKRQYEHYVKASNIASRFAIASSKQEAEEARKQFWEVYNGELSIVEDENVKLAMMKFGGAVKAWEKENTPTSDFSAPSIFELEDASGESLTFEQLSYQLSQACKNSLDR
jgi:hypothetical protein